MLVTTYLVNLLCAMVECRGRMPPPEAYIAEYTEPPFTVEATRKQSDPLNGTQTINLNSDSIYVEDNLYAARTKRLFPFLFPQNGNEILKNRTTRIDQSLAQVNLQNSMHSLANAIPNLFSSVSRIMQHGNNLDTTGFNFRSGRSGIDNEVGRNAHGDQLPVVFLKHGGGVEGYYMGTMNGRKISAFEGIPYAMPPTGPKRFKPPVPVKPWKGIRKAQKPGNSCLQTHPLYFFRVTGSENCLFANVYSRWVCQCT